MQSIPMKHPDMEHHAAFARNSMSISTNSDFIDFIIPIADRIKLYDVTKPPADQPKNDDAEITKAIPQGFIDAMIVREQVFCHEQNVPLENEVDEDDSRSFHWVAYASMPAKSTPVDTTSKEGKTENNDKYDGNRRKSTSTKIPIGTIRLVPPPHPPHPATGKDYTDVQEEHEAYVKLGRLAVIPEFRKAGIASLLVSTALTFVREHPNDAIPFMNPMDKELTRSKGKGTDFNGLVLVHAQEGVQKVWAKYGFTLDESMGKWDEESISHVGMWKKLDVTEGRKRSRILDLPGYKQGFPFLKSV